MNSIFALTMDGYISVLVSALLGMTQVFFAATFSEYYSGFWFILSHPFILDKAFFWFPDFSAVPS